MTFIKKLGEAFRALPIYFSIYFCKYLNSVRMTDPTIQLDETNFDYLLTKKSLVEEKSNLISKKI